MKGLREPWGCKGKGGGTRGVKQRSEEGPMGLSGGVGEGPRGVKQRDRGRTKGG